MTDDLRILSPRVAGATIALVAVLLVGATGALASGGSFASFDVPACQNVVGGLNAIATGPDGNLWYTDPTGGIGRISPSGTSATCFPVAYASNPTGIVAGADGNLWFRENTTNQIGRITPAGKIKTFSIPTSSGFVSLIVNPSDIAAGPDGNIWFTELGDNQIGRITPSGTITEFDVPTAGAHPSGIVAGPDGNLWFTESDGNQIGRITPSGTITEFPIPTANSGPGPITRGPDGNVWFGETNANQIGRITPTGQITEFPLPAGSGSASALTAGPDGNVWFTQPGQVGQITPTGRIAESSVPSALGITVGPDGNLWLAETQPDLSRAFPENVVGRMPAAPLPSNTSPPTISGVAKEGQTLTEHHGQWTNSPSSYSYQWDKCASTQYGVFCYPFSGATAQTFALPASAVGWAIEVQETATTSAGGEGGPAASAMTALVAPSPPSDASPPTISGSARVGQTLTESHGTWSYGPITGYRYQWNRCDASGSNCGPISGATGQTYVLTGADVGDTIRVAETASNAVGSGAPATSSATPEVAIPGARASVSRVKIAAGILTVPVSCSGAGAATCAVTATLTVAETVRGHRVLAVSARKRPKTKKRVVVLATGTATLAGGQSGAVRLSLDGAGERLLSKHHRLKVELTVTSSSAGTSGTVAQEIVTFVKSRRHRR